VEVPLTVDVSLLNDTGTSGSDLVTEDPRLDVEVSGDFPAARVQFDHDGDGDHEGQVSLFDPGQATYDPVAVDPNLETSTGRSRSAAAGSSTTCT
jgi:hypothetical protein